MEVEPFELCSCGAQYKRDRMNVVFFRTEENKHVGRGLLLNMYRWFAETKLFLHFIQVYFLTCTFCVKELNHYFIMPIYILLLKHRMWILSTTLLAGSEDAFVVKRLCALFFFFLFLFFWPSSAAEQLPTSPPISCRLFTVLVWSSSSACKREDNGFCRNSCHILEKCTLGQLAALKLSLCTACNELVTYSGWVTAFAPRQLGSDSSTTTTPVQYWRHRS